MSKVKLEFTRCDSCGRLATKERRYSGVPIEGDHHDWSEVKEGDKEKKDFCCLRCIRESDFKRGK